MTLTHSATMPSYTVQTKPEKYKKNEYPTKKLHTLKKMDIDAKDYLGLGIKTHERLKDITQNDILWKRQEIIPFWKGQEYK